MRAVGFGEPGDLIEVTRAGEQEHDVAVGLLQPPQLHVDPVGVVSVSERAGSKYSCATAAAPSRRVGRSNSGDTLAIYARPMTDQREFFVSYAGAMTPDDREAFARMDWKIDKTEGGRTGRWQGEGKPFVRLRAHDAEAAMRLVAEAIGHRPPGLRAREAKSRE